MLPKDAFYIFRKFYKGKTLGDRRWTWLWHCGKCGKLECGECVFDRLRGELATKMVPKIDRFLWLVGCGASTHTHSKTHTLTHRNTKINTRIRRCGVAFSNSPTSSSSSAADDREDTDATEATTPASEETRYSGASLWKKLLLYSNNVGLISPK